MPAPKTPAPQINLETITLMQSDLQQTLDLLDQLSGKLTNTGEELTELRAWRNSAKSLKDLLQVRANNPREAA